MLRRRAAALFLIAFGLAGCRQTSEPAKHSPDTASGQSSGSSSGSSKSPAGSGKPVLLEMRNVRLHLADDIVLDVRSLQGQMISRTSGEPPVFDDSQSYTVQLTAGETAIDMTNLSNLMNHHVFGYDKAPLSDLKLSVDDEGRLEQKGKLHKGVTLPFSMKAGVTAAPDGRMRLDAQSIKVAGVPAKGLLDFLGVSLDDMVKLREERGVEVEGDSLFIAPGRVLPPPEMRGQLTSVAVTGNVLVQQFGQAVKRASIAPADARARNYVYFSGNVLRFGKLTMTGADLMLIDADPSDAFDFYPAKYAKQLTAGYSLTIAGGGLRTYMPDFDDASVGKRARPK